MTETCPQRPFLVRYSTQIVNAVEIFGAALLFGITLAFYLLWASSGRPPLIAFVFAVLSVVGVFHSLALGRCGFAADIEMPRRDRLGFERRSVARTNNSVVQRENMVVQNHMASVAKVKAGRFRQILLYAVLKGDPYTGGCGFESGKSIRNQHDPFCTLGDDR